MLPTYFTLGMYTLACFLLALLSSTWAATSSPYFSVVKDPSTGALWLSRNGTRFFLKGVTSVNRGGLREGAVGPYYNVTLQRYGSEPEVFRHAVSSRLRHWSFNSLGAWATREFWCDAPDCLPYTVDVECAFAAPPSMRIFGGMPDVFDPLWLAYVDSRVENVTSVTSTAPYNLVGYFTDNELGWPHFCDAFKCLPPSSTPLPIAQQGLGLLQQCLSLTPDRPAYTASWNFVLARHGGSLAALSLAWELPTPVTTQAEVLTLYTQQNLTLASAGLQQDDDAWLGVGGYGGTYFNATAAAIRRVDPNHLVIGCKFGGPVSPSIYAANAAGHDAVSLDNYRYNMAARVQAVVNATGKDTPVIIAEFSWEGSDCPVAPGADELECCTPGADPAIGGFPCPVPLEVPSNNLTNLDRMYCNGGYSLAQTIAVPQVVGWTWYRWVDEGGDQASPFSQLGLVSLRDSVKPLAVSLLTSINDAAESIHQEGGWGGLGGLGLGGGSGSSGTWLEYCPFY